MRSSTKRGFTLIELLVVIAIIAILASILFPVFAKAREQARKATCISQVRQIAVAIQMYAQDNGSKMPGNSWVSDIDSYLGKTDKMFFCPSDGSKESGGVSYAYSGLLLGKDAKGIKESLILSPSEVGCVADATPTETYPTCRVLGGGGMLDEAAYGAVPAARHSKGLVAGYCDGHAKYIASQPNDQDMSNGITRAFYQVASLGLIDNPLGMVGAGTGIAGSYGTVTVGGEYVAAPLVMAAAQMYGSYYTRGFNGASADTGLRGSNYLWGHASGAGGYAGTAVAYDALVFIVAKGSKIPGLTLSNATYATNTTSIATLFGYGYQANTVQSYYMDASKSSTAAWAQAILAQAPGGEAVQVANDLEMVEKVSNDPYAIGYCSSVFADPDRVTVLSLEGKIWPSPSTKYRWVLPTSGAVDWPYVRKIYVEAAGTGGLALESALEQGQLGTALKAGPLFKGGYLAP